MSRLEAQVSSVGRQRGVFARDMLLGLTRRPKAVSPKWLYDARGAALFEQITQLPEYYLTRTEVALLERHGADLAAGAGRDAVVIELGAGSSRKTPLLLAALDRPALYVALDTSIEAFLDAQETIATRFPKLRTRFVEGDFTDCFSLPADVRQARGRRIGFFPGSTLGNLAPSETCAVLARLRALLGGDGMLILGVDAPKKAETLLSAYDDGAGVTAAFNLNLLHRMNSELGANFQMDRFRHLVRLNAAASRIEMHLASVEVQRSCLCGHSVTFAAGETIHTENSYKYTQREIARFAAAAGWRLGGAWWSADPAYGLYRLE